MVSNYIKTYIRLIQKHKLFSFLNITSLSLGLLPCILLFFLLEYEYSFDTFHKDADKIYRIVLDGHHKSGPYQTINVSPKLTEAIMADFPEAHKVTRLYHNGGPVKMKNGNKIFNESDYLFADSNIFEVFNIDLIQGDPNTALSHHHSIVLTKELAEKYFGSEDPIGKTINVDIWVNGGSANPWSKVSNPSGIDPAGEYLVTGIVRELPPNSHIQFNSILSMASIQWWDMWNKDLFSYNAVATYISLPSKETANKFVDKLNQRVESYHRTDVEKNMEVSYDQFIAEGKRIEYSLLPLLDMHFGAEGLQGRFEKFGNFDNLYYLAVISLISLLIGSINFINITTARSSTRLKEIGVRKVAGSGRRSLIFQFLLESTLLTSISFVLALLFAFLLLPNFNDFLNVDISLNNILYSWTLPLLLLFTLLVGVISGTYPALLTSKAPAGIIKGTFQKPGRGHFRNALVIFQYGISIVFIMGALIVNGQLNFLKTMDLGFTKDQVLVLKGSPRLNFLIRPTPSKYIDLKESLMNLDGVKGVSGAGQIFGTEWLVHCNLRMLGDKIPEEGTVYRLGFGDINLLENFDIEIKSDTILDVTGNRYFLTESAVKELGISDPVGEYLIRTWPYESGQWKSDLDTFIVAGIIKDLQYNSAQNEIEPVGLVLADDYEYNAPMDALYVLLDGENTGETLAAIEGIWKDKNPEQPFVYSFLDSQLAEFYSKENRLAKIISIFSILAIIISCLGILGLSAFLAQQKSKEISIRKIFGASIFNVIRLLLKKHTILLVISLVIFIPSAVFLAERWLTNYPFRIEVGIEMIFVTTITIILITLLSLSWQLMRGIKESPLKTIRTE